MKLNCGCLVEVNCDCFISEPYEEYNVLPPTYPEYLIVNVKELDENMSKDKETVKVGTFNRVIAKENSFEQSADNINRFASQVFEAFDRAEENGAFGGPRDTSKETHVGVNVVDFKQLAENLKRQAAKKQALREIEEMGKEMDDHDELQKKISQLTLNRKVSSLKKLVDQKIDHEDLADNEIFRTKSEPSGISDVDLASLDLEIAQRKEEMKFVSEPGVLSDLPKDYTQQDKLKVMLQDLRKNPKKYLLHGPSPLRRTDGTSLSTVAFQNKDKWNQSHAEVLKKGPGALEKLDPVVLKEKLSESGRFLKIRKLIDQMQKAGMCGLTNEDYNNQFQEMKDWTEDQIDAVERASAPLPTQVANMDETFIKAKVDLVLSKKAATKAEKDFELDKITEAEFVSIVKESLKLQREFHLFEKDYAQFCSQLTREQLAVVPEKQDVNKVKPEELNSLWGDELSVINRVAPKYNISGGKIVCRDSITI